MQETNNTAAMTRSAVEAEPCRSACPGGECNSLVHAGLCRLAGAFGPFGPAAYVPIFGSDYPDFSQDAVCAAYVREYVPMHLTQLRFAIGPTLARAGAAGLPEVVRVLDVGAGPGTAELALASLTPETRKGRRFEVTTLDPSRPFGRAADRLRDLLASGGVDIQRRIEKPLGQLLRAGGESLPETDWIVVCNALSSFCYDARAAECDVGSLVAELVDRAAGQGRWILVSVIETKCCKYLEPQATIGALRSALSVKWRLRDVLTLSSPLYIPTKHLRDCRMFVSLYGASRTSLVCANWALERT